MKSYFLERNDNRIEIAMTDECLENGNAVAVLPALSDAAVPVWRTNAASARLFLEDVLKDPETIVFFNRKTITGYEAVRGVCVPSALHCLAADLAYNGPVMLARSGIHTVFRFDLSQSVHALKDVYEKLLRQEITYSNRYVLLGLEKTMYLYTTCDPRDMVFFLDAGFVWNKLKQRYEITAEKATKAVMEEIVDRIHADTIVDLEKKGFVPLSVVERGSAAFIIRKPADNLIDAILGE